MLIQQSLKKFEESCKEKKQFRKIISMLRELLFNNVVTVKDIEVCSRICLAA